MKAKKIFKIIGKIILVLLALIVLLLITTTVIYHIKLSKAKNTMKENGYYNLVSAGDYDVNLYRCGNENGKHTIIALAGYGDGEMCIGWRPMTEPLEADNQIIFVDRAGYGFSDDCKDDMTVEHIVEHYRTALQNAGVPKPYVLLPHSIGGLYATYWVSKYPDEVEAVMVLDGTECEPISSDEQELDLGITKIVMYAEKVGLLPMLVRSDYSTELSSIKKEYHETVTSLVSKTLGSKAAVSETMNFGKNINFTWNAIETNDIPKVYLSVSNAFHTKEELIEEGITADVLRDNGFEYVTDKSDEAVYEEALKVLAQYHEILNRYTEKMGNCQLVELRGQHEIMFDKPVQCGKIIKDFIDSLDN